jgi:hypothetical protein
MVEVGLEEGNGPILKTDIENEDTDIGAQQGPKICGAKPTREIVISAAVIDKGGGCLGKLDIVLSTENSRTRVGDGTEQLKKLGN